MRTQTRLSAALLALLTGLLAGCGYVGDPLPPALNIPKPVEDLRVMQVGDKLLVDFTIPLQTMEGLPVRNLGPIELRIGPGGSPFDQGQWAASAREIPLTAAAPGAVHKEIPLAEWTSKEVVAGLRLSNDSERKSQWSNLVSVRVQLPVPVPAPLKAEATATGVRLTWPATGSNYRVFRKAPGEEKLTVLAESQSPEYLDATAQWDRTYEYAVQALRDQAVSEFSPPVSVTPKDVFPPAVPTGLTAISGVGAIEVGWERNTEPDLRGYRLYRAPENGDFQRLGDLLEIPTYSDKQIETGKRYRYAVTAIDQAGNESARSAVAEALAP